jgi:Ca2+-binding RTX toxin-like protein
MNLYGGASPDWLNGTAASDMLVGLGGADCLFGLGGEDLLIGGEGGDYLFGGSFFGESPEFDLAAYWDSWDGVYVDLASGLGYGGTAQGDHLYGIEGLFGSLYADQLAGNDGANVLEGSYGDDWLLGRGGADELYGGSDNDTLEGGSGSDVLNGGSGTDTAYYAWSSEGVSVSLQSGHGSSGDAAGDTYLWVENVVGSRTHDTIEGDWADNRLSGLDGNDTLRGFDGADTLEGGMGRDLLDGGAGADTFVWTSTAETTASIDGPYGPDIIVGEFDPAVDRIDLRQIDADETAGGNQTFAYVTGPTFTAPGQIRIEPAFPATPGWGCYVMMNTDMDADAEAVIWVYPGPGYPDVTLGEGCFML